MKKKNFFKTAAMIFLLLFFCGCNSGNFAKTPECFSAKISAEFMSEQYEFDMTKEQTGKYIFTVIAPSTLEGLTVTYADGVTELAFFGMKNTLPSADTRSVFAKTARIFDDSSLPNRLTYCGKKGGEETFSGNLEGKTYKISYKNGQPQSFSLSDGLSARVEG